MLAELGLPDGLAGFFAGVKPCAHFDFGAELRKIADAPTPPKGFDDKEIKFVQKVLADGALLEDDSFPLAEKILSLYIRNSEGRVLVMNGLPRHTGQAEALKKLIDVKCVLHFDCDSATAAKRIKNNTGGDRACRKDDNPKAIAKRHAIYLERTSKLIDYYQKQGVPVVRQVST